MTRINNDKVFGFIMVAAVSTGFIGTTNVQAAPLFPPQHVAADARFASIDTDSRQQAAAQPWYRSGERQAAIVAPVDAIDPATNVTFASDEQASWYRAAN